MPISAVDTITLAFHHTKRQLIQPFRFWQWTRLAFVGLLAGEMGSGGSFNVPSNFKIPQHVRFVEQFPMTVTGKIQKFRIREIETKERGLESVARRETA